MRKLILNILLFFSPGFLLTSCQHADCCVSADEFQAIIESSNDSVIIIDVRTQTEYHTGHITNAVNVNMLHDSFLDIVKELVEPHQIIAVYCKSGRRSLEATKKLTKQGYRVVNLKEGILGWEKAGKKVTGYCASFSK